MSFKLTEKYVERLRRAIEDDETVFIQKRLKRLHPADIAQVFNELDIEDAKKLYKHLDEDEAGKVLIEMEEDVREKFLDSLTSKEIAEQFIDNMPSDDAADVLAELSDEKQDEVLAHVEDTEQASDLAELLSYDENTAGGLMATELIRVHVNKNVIECVREMRRQAEHVRNVYAIYVVDDDDRLLGLLPLKKLLLVPARSIVRDIYNPEIISVKTDTPAEEVAKIMEKYDLVVLPVIDTDGKLVGRITIDDVVDVIREEAVEDMQMMAGISEKVESTDRIWILSRARLPWLMVGFVGEIINSRLIGGYEGQLIMHPEMAFFMPLIAAMGGNVGVQSSSIVVQGLANDSFLTEGAFKKIFKEFNVGLVNGLICSVLILGFNLLIHIPMALSITVSAALLSVILFASVFGTAVPLILNKMKFDPALATGPFITTINDILAMFLYFSIGMLMF